MKKEILEKHKKLIDLLFTLEFNYDSISIDNTIDTEILKFKHSTKLYHLEILFSCSYNLYTFYLYFVDKEKLVLISESQTPKNEITIQNLYYQIIFPFVLNYHIYNLHYKYLNRKFVNPSVVEYLELSNLEKIIKNIENITLIVDKIKKPFNRNIIKFIDLENNFDKINKRI